MIGGPVGAFVGGIAGGPVGGMDGEVGLRLLGSSEPLGLMGGCTFGQPFVVDNRPEASGMIQT
jgi:hypothetical protein